MSNAFTPLHYVLLALSLAVVVAEVFAVIDAAIRPARAFVAAGKLTKPAWIGILIGTAVIELLIPFVAFVGLVAAIVYLVDVRPKVRELGAGGSNMGPYGPW